MPSLPSTFALLLAATIATGCGLSGPPGAALSRAAQGARAMADDEPLLTLPRFTRNKGKDNEPVNLVVAAEETQLQAVFDQSGWLPADPLRVSSVMKMAMALLTHGEYPRAPISTIFFLDRAQDLAYQKNTRGITSRDHFRAWKTALADAAGRPYWAIAASRDASIKLSLTHPAHHIDPHLDACRGLLVDDLVATGKVAHRRTLQALPPKSHGLNGEGDPWESDGRMEVLELE